MGSATWKTRLFKTLKNTLMVASFVLLLVGYPVYVFSELKYELDEKGQVVQSHIQAKVEDMYSEMSRLLESTSLRCDRPTIRAMRLASFHSPYLVEFGLLDENYHVYCTNFGETDFPLFRSLKSKIENAPDHRYLSISRSKIIKEQTLFVFLYDPERQVGINGLAPPKVLLNDISVLLGDGFDYQVYVGLEQLGQQDILAKNSLVMPYSAFVGTSDIFISVALKDAHIWETFIKDFHIVLSIALILLGLGYTGFSIKSAKQSVFVNSVRKRISKREIDVYFQPVIDVETRRIFGAETLLKLELEGVGLIDPRRIMSIAIEYNLMTDLACMVIRRIGAMYRSNKGTLSDIPIAVNLDLATLLDNHFIDELTDLSVLYPELECRLVLETYGTYRLSGGELEELCKKVDKIRELGFMISVDDFGAGYSDVCSLQRVAIDAIKLDRQFVLELVAHEKDNADLVRHVLAFSNERGIPLIVDSVESFEQLEVLTSLGIHYIQGYFYNRALSEREFVKVAEKRSSESSRLSSDSSSKVHSP